MNKDRYPWRRGMELEIVTSPVRGRVIGHGRLYGLTKRFVILNDGRKFGRVKGGRTLCPFDPSMGREFIRPALYRLVRTKATCPKGRTP